MSCIYQTPQEQLDQAEVVVEGVVTDIQTAPESTTVTVDVNNVIKGTPSDPLTIVTGYGSTMATSVDFVFTDGATYKIYLYQDETGQLTTNSCTGTTLLADAATETPTADITTANSSYTMLWGGIAVVTVILIGLVVVGLKMRRGK